ncbi:MAG: hypothetical protein ACOYUZ_04920 [Patescibacteria group bacterium]
MSNVPESWNYGFASGVEAEHEQSAWNKAAVKRILGLKRQVDFYERKLKGKLHFQYLLHYLEQFSEAKDSDYQDSVREYGEMCKNLESGSLPSDYFAPDEAERLFRNVLKNYQKDFPQL